jgi:hypothetical protein
MKKILAVFLLFISCSLLAQEEMGKLIIEFRDYEIDNNDPRWSLGDWYKEYPQYSFQEYGIHIINTISPKYSLPYSDIQKYLDHWPARVSDGGSYSSQVGNKKIITENYRLTEEGRWRPIFAHFPKLATGQERVINSKGITKNDSFDYAAQIFTLAWMGDEPGTRYSWDSTWDLNEEEVYWIGPNMIRKDEQGRPMHSFKVEIIFYKE